MTIEQQVRSAFDAVQVDGSVTAVDLTTGAGVDVDASTPRPLASVAKLPLVWVLLTLHHEGELDASTPLVLDPAHRTIGPVGTGRLRDPITMSARDAAYYAMSLSDNGAADAIWDFVGAERVQETLARLGLPDLRLRAPMRRIFELLEDQRRRERLDDAALLRTDPRTLDPLDPARVSSGTTAALTRFLAEMHGRAAGGSQADREVVDLMGAQLVRNRLASGFPAADLDVRGKTGTLLAVRHEVGYVTYPDGRAYAVSVLTSSRSLQIHHRVDAVIGEVARAAVLHLRR